MIEIIKANKYFNKGKNKIQAINNTSLKLDNNGLVALLGPSGCGKTTLLNCIGGLDKLKKGNIYIDGKKISSRSQYKVDKIRNLSIGYIFQDYKLINTMSVYDNVSIVLKMLGIKDKDEIDKRVLYVLDKVGMLRYKKRPCGMLSGGERQRVGIARAIVKDPDIILADEPTGNLDSKNSLEIMKIIKSISRDRLVVLVTHEVSLAKFYANRIIEIEDGIVKNDYSNLNNNELDYEIDNNFYLKDFKYQENLSSKKYDINIYSNDKNRINLDIVIFNGNLYIKSNNNDKIEVVDDNDSIEFINDNYKKIESSDIDKYKFEFDSIINKDIKKRYCSIFNLVGLIVNGFKKVFSYTFLKKILLGGFFLSGMFLMYAVSSIFATLKIDEKDFISVNRNYVSVVSKNILVDDYLNYENIEEINYIIPGDSIVKFNINYSDYYQTNYYIKSYDGSLASLDMINGDDLIYGTISSSSYEVVVDKMFLDNILNLDETTMIGIFDISDFLNRYLFVDNMDKFKIVGIVDSGSPSVYVNNNMFMNIISSNNGNINDIFDYELFKDKIEIKKGRVPSNDYEVLVNINDSSIYPLNKECDIKINNKKLVVVGYYDSKYNYNYYFVNNNTIKYNNIVNIDNMSIYTKDKDAVINKLLEMGLNTKDSYKRDRDNYINSRKDNIKNSLIVSGIILFISLIEIFFMVRSSFLSRVKEVGIYRAIGLKRLDIYKMFFGEIVAISTLASVPGIIFMAYALSVMREVKYFSCLFMVNIFTVGITIIFIYIFNLVVGLMPVFNTVRKRPAAILARYDLD